MAALGLMSAFTMVALAIMAEVTVPVSPLEIKVPLTSGKLKLRMLVLVAVTIVSKAAGTSSISPAVAGAFSSRLVRVLLALT